jgi:hypothetical protein
MISDIISADCSVDSDINSEKDEKTNETRVVLLPYAVVYPFTVMVVFSDAFLANDAMSGVFVFFY